MINFQMFVPKEELYTELTKHFTHKGVLLIVPTMDVQMDIRVKVEHKEFFKVIAVLLKVSYNNLSHSYI